MPTTVLLAMHGTPPSDFPQRELGEYFALHAQAESRHSHLTDDQVARHKELERRMRDWPRTRRNDPFQAGSMDLAAELERALGLPVVVGFNEFCAPDLHEAFDQVASQKAARVVVLTPMLTRGGGHAEVEIPHAIEAARKRHPQMSFHYAWPIPEADVAGFLAKHVNASLARTPLSEPPDPPGG